MKDIFLTNTTEITFLDKIKESLSKCNKFYFTVSFIKKAGLVLMLDSITEALDRGCSGKIITSTYQNFTDVASLYTFKSLMSKYTNFSCHLDYNCFGDNGFHSKGYLFEYNDSYEFIVGSTNITRFALLKNVEWNVSLQSSNQLNSIDDALAEFDILWNNTKLLDDELIKNYKLQLEYAIEKWDMDYFNPESDNIKPNAMQRKALKELRRNRDLGVNKSLVVSATGSGKTYLAAFDARNFDAKRLLFIVHRESILKDALKTFANVFQAERSYGLFTGNEDLRDAEFVFASTSMLLKHIDEFSPDEFDYLVYDEVHHMASDGGMKIFNHFKPEFLLGLTATPERMDSKDVFGLFDNNVPFELRLNDAIINNLVVPFHYYGIRDEYADYSSQDKSIIAREIAKNENIELIVSNIEKYRKQGEKLKAIAFCTSIAHCNTMADEFNSFGYSAVALTGSNDIGQRIKAFKSLQDETAELEIICAVDILNEGVDIPALNMVLFLRPTESTTIFLQQLGRGLRKAPNKEYITVLDFIGNNYDRSVQIALALGTLGKTTYTEKEYLKEMVRTNFESLNIPNVKIMFDELSKIEIINRLNSVNFNRMDYLKKDYENFKNYLALDNPPKHIDYLDSELAPDLMRLIKSNTKGKNKSYYKFLKKIGEAVPLFNESQEELIDNISEMLPIVRLDEYLILNQLINESKIDITKLVGYDNRVTNKTLTHALMILNKKKIITNDNKLNCDFITNELKEYLNDLISYGILRYEAEFNEYEGKFKYLANYYKEQIMMILLEETLMFMKGTKFDGDETYCFVGLKKDKSKEELTNYKDKFIDSKTFQWESENNTTFTNLTGIKLQNTKVVHLFVRKMDDEFGTTLPFTYFGTGKFDNVRETVNVTINGDKPTLTYDIILDNEVPEEYYLDFNIEKKHEVV